MALRSRRIRVGVLLGAIVLLVAAGALGELMRPAMEPDQVVESRFGDVKWNHELHARMASIGNCQVCHHTSKPGEMQPRACHDCHKRDKGVAAVALSDLHTQVDKPKYEGEHGPPPMTAFHGKCVGCHKAMKEGPVGCKDCHAQSFVGKHGRVEWDHTAHARRIDMGEGYQGKDACKRCHHQDKEASWDGDYRGCAACHDDAPGKDLKVATGIKFHEKIEHGDCKRCHVTRNPEEDGRTCKDCHKGYVVDTDKGERPPIEQAVHARCMECHRADWPGLTPGMPVACRDCHEPDQSVLADLEIGLLLWDHDGHAKRDGMACNTCHHKDAEGQPHMACNKCHGTGLYENPSVSDALRKRCLDCHKEQDNGLLAWDAITKKSSETGGSVVPTDLVWHTVKSAEGTVRWNHQQHAVAYSFSCKSCHHGLLRQDGQYVSGSRDGAAWTGKDARIQACGACHGEAGPVAGSLAEGSKAPAYDAAMKKVCLECHQRLGGGPQTWAAYFAKEPLKRGSESGAEGEVQR